MTTRLPFEKMKKITDPLFVQVNYIMLNPDEILDGTIKYDNQDYYFKYNHQTDNSNVYVVLDQQEQPILYFVLYYNPTTNKMDSLIEND